MAKEFSDRLITKMRYVMKLNQKKITKFVVYWFKNIENKQMHRFIKFDVKNFYPSISINALQEAPALAKNYCVIRKESLEGSFFAQKIYVSVYLQKRTKRRA